MQNTDSHTLLQQALQHHQAGQLPEAEALYRQLLQTAPHHVDALHFLGILSSQLGKNTEAVQLINQAISLNPSSAMMYGNLGNILKVINQSNAAIESYQKALTLEPNNADVHFNLGLMLQEQGNPIAALAHYDSVLMLQPNYVSAYYNRGIILKEQGDLDAAQQQLQQAIALKPDYVDAYNHLGLIFYQKKQWDTAIACYQHALSLSPDSALIHNNLGMIFQAQMNLVDAIKSYRQAIEFNPNYATAYSNLGSALEAQNNQKAAIESYRHALLLNPTLAETRYNLGMALLYTGQFAEGWQLCEARLDLPNCATVPAVVNFPQWRGESLKGKSIVILREQGFGDEIQFSRYATVLKNQGAKQITWLCKKPLKSILQKLEGIDTVLTETEATMIPAHDYWVFALTIPLYCKTTFDTIPSKTPYLYADLKQTQQIAAELKHIRTLKVGICWQGNPQFKNDSLRSPGILPFQSLFKMSGVKFFTLQPDTRTEFLKFAGNHAVDRGHEIKSENFEEAAALIMNLDLVISSCTSICHLAGALGKPVWIVLPFVADWRWLENKENSPWYSTARLFRQTQLGDWTEVFARVEKELNQLITHPNLSLKKEILLP
jgi:tetratricopeptide (TPR) repeat protein